MTKQHIWGATPAEWDHFRRLLGEDLLPTVCDPNVPPTSRSTIKKFSKIPSDITTAGEAYGILKFPMHKANHRQIDRWSADDRLGICAITRTMRAIDIDITSASHADKIESILIEEIGYALPARTRPNSSKRTLLCTLSPHKPEPKRKITTRYGVIEFLADRQQTLLCGMHESGVRYTFRDGLPHEIPDVAIEDLARAWDRIAQAYGTDEDVQFFDADRSLNEIPKRTSSLQMEDHAIDALEKTGLVRRYHPDGRVEMDCPWSEEHTSESSSTATMYYPRGHNGIEQPGFKCMHAHCANRSVLDLYFKIDYKEPENHEVVQYFDAVEPTSNALPELRRTKNGKPVPGSLYNASQMMASPEATGVNFRMDSFMGTISISPKGVNMWRPLTDDDVFRARLALEKYEVCVTKDTARDAISATADANAVDTAQVWLNGLKWDGIKRIDTFADLALSTVETPYTTAVSRYMWTAMAGRVLVPGIKADMVPVWMGKQGNGKTTMIKNLVPNPEENYLEVDLTTRDDNLARAMRGKLVGELAELKGLDTRDKESIKAWITRTHEEWIPKFKEHSNVYKRRAVFIGTTNKFQFLNDPTGERRWLPIPVATTRKMLGLDWVKENLEQLWAEAAELFREHGVMWQEADRLATPARAMAKKRDVWLPLVMRWLNDEGHQTVNVPLVFSSALNGRLDSLTDFVRSRIESCLIALGWEQIGDDWQMIELA